MTPTPLNITKAEYDAAIAQRDQARREVLDIRTKLEITELALARARQDIGVYRRHWNSATAELKKMMDRACRKKPKKRSKR